MITHKLLTGNILLELESGKKLTYDSTILRDHARGKNNMLVVLMPGDKKITLGRKHVDESEVMAGPGAVNVTPQSVEQGMKPRKNGVRTHARTPHIARSPQLSVQPEANGKLFTFTKAELIRLLTQPELTLKILND